MEEAKVFEFIDVEEKLRTMLSQSTNSKNGAVPKNKDEEFNKSKIQQMLNTLPDFIRPHLYSMKPYSLKVLHWFNQNNFVDISVRRLLQKYIPSQTVENLARSLEELYEQIRTETTAGRLYSELQTKESYLSFVRSVLARIISDEERLDNFPASSPQGDFITKQNGDSPSFNQSNSNETIHRENSHRLKNHLNRVISLINLKRRNSDTDTEIILNQAIRMLQNVIQVNKSPISGMDESRSTVDLDYYITDNLRSLVNTFAPDTFQANFNVHVDPVDISNDQITIIGQIINELVINSIQHGYNADSTATLSVSLKNNADFVELVTEDDGSGLPEDFEWSENTHGLKIIEKLVRDQLNGTFEPNKTTNGTGWIARFPLSQSHQKTNGLNGSSNEQHPTIV